MRPPLLLLLLLVVAVLGAHPVLATEQRMVLKGRGGIIVDPLLQEWYFLSSSSSRPSSAPPVPPPLLSFRFFRQNSDARSPRAMEARFICLNQRESVSGSAKEGAERHGNSGPTSWQLQVPLRRPPRRSSRLTGRGRRGSMKRLDGREEVEEQGRE